MQGRIPAARHREQIAIDRDAATAYSGKRPDIDAAQRGTAGRRDDGMAGEKRNTVDQRQRRVAGPVARVDDRGDRHPGPIQRGGGVVGIVIVGEQHGAGSRRDGIAVDIGLDRARQHHAGAIVAGEDERPLQCASREHDSAGADMPQPLARQSGRRRGTEPLADTFGRNQVIVVVMPEHRRARQQADLRHCLQLGDRGGGPGGALAIADPVRAAQQRAAEERLAVGEDDPGAAPAGGERGGKAGRAGADHQHIAMDVALVVARGIGQCRRAAEPGHAAQQWLPQMPPESARLHEGLVVEAGREQRREAADQRAQIDAKARAGMLARRV